MQIAINAGERKVVEVIAAAVSLRNNVFDVKRGQRGIILMKMTILASVLGALANVGSDLYSDHLGRGVSELLGLPFENSHELVRSHISGILGPLVFSEFPLS